MFFWYQKIIEKLLSEAFDSCMALRRKRNGAKEKGKCSFDIRK